MTANYTIVDVQGTLKAVFLMSLFVFIPGYVIGWTLDVLGFRSRRTILKLLLSVPLAIACCPTVTYLLGRTSQYAMWAFYGSTWAVFAVLAAGIKRLPRRRISKYAWLSLAIAGAWFVVGAASLVDLQLGDRLYFSVPAYDYSVRTAFTAAVARALPPTNPFFTSNPPILLRYHYFWPLLCSLATKLGDIAPRHALFGGTLWCGVGLMSLIALYVKFFLRPASNIERKSLIGVCLLLATGLDIIPTIILRMQVPHRVAPDMEWWNSPQITSWIDSMLWVPHHIAGLIACLTGFLVIYVDQRRRVAAVVGGLAFASAAGLSIYVTLTFAVFIAVWGVVTLVGGNRRGNAATALIAAAVAICCGLPYLLTLRGAGQGGAFIGLEVRPFSFGTGILQEYGLRQYWLAYVTPALLLPLNYFLELGFFLLVGIDRVRKLCKREVEFTRDEMTAWIAVASSFLVGTFLRSNTIANNDLGYRSFLLAQFFLLLWAVPVVDGWLFTPKIIVRSRRAGGLNVRIATACLILGAIGTVYQAVELRFYSLWADRGGVFRRSWMDGDGQLGRRTYALRVAYEKLDAGLNRSAVIQFNPLTPTYLPHLLYTGHPAAAVGQDCGSEFGGRRTDCIPRIREFTRVFGGEAPLIASQVDDICRHNGVDVMLAKDSDPVWQDRSSWVWREQPLVANEYVRAFRCGKSVSSSSVNASSAHP